jgi:phosphatidylinositol N-acetylglucosaminyltransferase subunit C
VVIFVCCFTGIFQERVSPITVVGWGSAGTVFGWIAWDIWVGREEDLAKARSTSRNGSDDGLSADSTGRDISPSSGTQTPMFTNFRDGHPDELHPPNPQIYEDPLSTLSPRNQQRLTTIKSAALIYCAVLGLSPILKSLTKSTTSDSIWAMSCWLMGINVFFFDYGGGIGAK